MLKRVRKSIIETSLTAIPVVVMVFAVGTLLWAFVNHRSALDYCLRANTLGGRIQIVDPQGEPLSQEAVSELLAKIEGARKEFFDSNTITFLWSLIFILGVNVAVYVYGRALKSLRQTEEQSASIARMVRQLVPLWKSLQVSDVIAMLYAQAEEGVASLASRPNEVAPVLRDTFTAIEDKLGALTRPGLGLEPFCYDRLILDVAQRTHLALAKLARPTPEEPAVSEIAREILEQSQRCLTRLRSRDLVRRYDTLLANVNDLPEGAR
jgi:hypothetical protein